jgi:hypothetical protein
MGVLGGVLSGDKQMAAIQNRTSEVNARAQNQVTGASNNFAAAQGALSRWTQSLNNQRALKAGGEALEANAVNYWRAVDAAASTDLSTSIRAAEAAGERAAMAAAAGVGGEVVDTINSTVRLRDSISRQQTKDYAGMAQYDTLRRAAGIAQQAVSSMDNSLIFDNLNFNVAAPQYRQATSYGQLALQGALKGGMQSVANGTADFSMAGLKNFVSGLPGISSLFGATETSRVVTDYSPASGTGNRSFGFRPSAPTSIYSLI